MGNVIQFQQDPCNECEQLAWCVLTEESLGETEKDDQCLLDWLKSVGCKKHCAEGCQKGKG